MLARSRVGGGREEGVALKGISVVMAALYLDHISVNPLAVRLHYSFARC